MKKHLSVFALWARHSLWKVLMLLAAMGVLETAMVLRRWDNRPADEPPPPLEDLWQGRTGPELICGIAFLLLVLLLMFACGDQKPNVGYTLRRLRIREETAVLWKSVYHGICLLLFWAVQTAVMLGVCCWYAAAVGPEYSSRQTVFLAVYRVEFFHNLLPLAHWLRWLTVAALLAALSFSSALIACKLRHGSKFGWGMAIFLIGLIRVCFSQGMGTWIFDAFCIAAAVCAVITESRYLRTYREEHYET